MTDMCTESMEALTLCLDRVEQEDGRSHPPRVSTQRFPWPCLEEHLIDIVKIGEIRIYFDDPVWLHQYHRTDEDEAHRPREKWLDFEPRNDIM